MCDNRRPEELGIDLNKYPVNYKIIEFDDLETAPTGLYHIGVYHTSSGCAHWFVKDKNIFTIEGFHMGIDINGNISRWT